MDNIKDIIIDYKNQLNICLANNNKQKTLTCISTSVDVGTNNTTIFRVELSNNIPIVLIHTPLMDNDRQLTYLKVVNSDTVSATILININNIDYIEYNMNIVNVTISPNDILYYNIKNGFFIIERSGIVKVVLNNNETSSISRISNIDYVDNTLDYFTKIQSDSQFSHTGHTHEQYSLTGHTHQQYSLTGHTHGWITGLDAFNRHQQHFEEQNSMLSFGGWQTDGSPNTISTEGAVFYGMNVNSIQSGSDGGYARIKPDRFGLANIISGVNDTNLFYYFRVDPSGLYLKNNDNIKTFDVDRTTGVVTANTFEGDIDWNHITSKPTFFSGLTENSYLKPAYGSLYEHNSASTTITVNNSGYTGWNTAISSNHYLTTLTKNSNGDRLTILSGGTGTYQINVFVNASFSNNTIKYYMGVYKNDILIDSLQCYVMITNTTDIYNISVNSIVDNVSVDDFFDIRFNSDNPILSNINIYNISLNMNRIRN